MKPHEKVIMDIPIDFSVFWLPPASNTHIWPIDLSGQKNFVFSKSNDLYIIWHRI